MVAAAIAATGGFLFGFDMAVISGVLPFIKKQFSLSAAEEGWFVSSALIGCIIGVSFSGSLSDAVGRKKMMVTAGMLFFLSAAGTTLAGSFSWLVLTRMLGGTGVGVASIVAPLYLSEISPAPIRGRLVTFYQLAITAGILIAYITNAALLHYGMTNRFNQGTLWGKIFEKEIWRGMLGIGVIPSLLFLFGLWFVPESPRWLIYNGRRAKGLAEINKLEGVYDEAAESPYVLKDDQNKVSILELFTSKLRRPLLIGILLPLFSQLSGINAVIYYGPRILNSAGIDISNAFVSQIIFGAANFFFTVIAIWKVDNLGRRPLYLIGSVGAALSLFFTGLCFYIGMSGGFILILCILAFLACFAFSIGPLKFVIAAEIFPTAIRGRAMGISIMVMWIADTVVGQLTPIMLNTLGTTWTFWTFSFCCILSFFVVLKLVPETKGKSLEEMQGFWSGH
ncbi:sugar porter family MFS transporter [Mucilaginibacter terrenus]|uniref:Sugar porter family MFS transporter n=2 Tax=Mucilaginibacter terrenus TaxID=2482727 RepID=A0A3E2NYL1_9SPHI|nr:sugar porter family MFS transporter [Mucilaginibacter terrenus]